VNNKDIKKKVLQGVNKIFGRWGAGALDPLSIPLMEGEKPARK